MDKITILEIKTERLQIAAARDNAAQELDLLNAIAMPSLGNDDKLLKMKAKLKLLNSTLWDIENGIRAKEASGQFDPDFIALARSVYTHNDARASMKRQINLLLHSTLIEEKNYHPYPVPGGNPPS